MRDVDFWKRCHESTLGEYERSKSLIKKVQEHINKLRPGNKKITPRNRRFSDKLKEHLARITRRSQALKLRLQYYDQQVEYLQGMSRFERVLKFPVI